MPRREDRDEAFALASASPIDDGPFDTAKAVESIAQGFVRLLSLGSANSPISSQRRCHVNILAVLEDSPRHRKIYLYLVWRFTLRGQKISESVWKNLWSSTFLQIAEFIVGHPIANQESKKFLGWTADGHMQVGRQASHANLFLYPLSTPRVAVRLGSIHSVKGETHAATLVLETFWYDHNLEKLLPWLRGKRTGGKGAGQRDINRLKLHFVAMTRPSNLLCLAMKRSSFLGDDGQLDQALLTDLKAMGWNIVVVTT